MELKIEFPDIFTNEDGEDEVSPSIKEQIINSVANKVFNSISGNISSIIENLTKARAKKMLDDLVPTLLDLKFIETSRYGSTKEPITVKDQILKDIEKEMVWRDGNWDSEKSIYTKTVRACLDQKFKTFTAEFNKQIDAIFVQECMNYAQEALRKRVGIK